MPLKRELMQCADLVPITTFCLFWWNFSRNGSYHICLHMATHGQLVTSCTSPSLGCRTVVSATPPKPKMPPSWSNRVWSRWCLSVAPCHGIMVPDAWRKRSQTSAKAALLPGGTANQPRMSNLVRSDWFNTEKHIVCNPCAISMKLLSKPNLRTQTTHNESQVILF